MAEEVEAISLDGKPIKNLGTYIKDTITEYFIQPDPSTGIGGVRLDIIGEQTLSAPTDSTDNYVESNVAYQDHIAIKPITYTIKGEVGELCYYDEPSSKTPVGFVTDKLNKLTSFVPPINKAVAQARDTAMKVFQVVDQVDNLWTRFSNLDSTQTNQQKAYLALMLLRLRRIPINVESPWTELNNYVITNLTLTQSARTRDKTEITVEVKQFRSTSLSTTKFNASQYKNRLADQKAPNVEQGQTNGRISSAAVLGGFRL